MGKSKYWNLALKNDGSNVADLYLYNIIDDYAYEDLTDSPVSIVKELNSLGKINTLNVFINSPGGSVFEGIAIKNQLERLKHDGVTVNVVVDGLAASIAAVIMTAGSTITVNNGAMVMIHSAWTSCSGNKHQLAAKMALLEKIDDEIVKAFTDRCGEKLTKNELLAMFESGDTWLSAEEALAYGLCDEIGYGECVAAQYDMSQVLNMYPSMPKLGIQNTKSNEPVKDKGLEGGKAMNKDDIVVTLDTAKFEDVFAKFLEDLKNELGKVSEPQEPQEPKDNTVEIVDENTIIFNGKTFVLKDESTEPKNEPQEPATPKMSAEQIELLNSLGIKL